MIRSFTGPKLQGDIGRFGNEELSDVLGYAELPDGKASLPQSLHLVTINSTSKGLLLRRCDRYQAMDTCCYLSYTDLNIHQL